MRASCNVWSCWISTSREIKIQNNNGGAIGKHKQKAISYYWLRCSAYVEIMFWIFLWYTHWASDVLQIEVLGLQSVSYQKFVAFISKSRLKFLWSERRHMWILMKPPLWADNCGCVLCCVLQGSADVRSSPAALCSLWLGHCFHGNH